MTRYFDHIQSRPEVRKAALSLAPAFSTVTFDLENAPTIERKADPPKKKEKAPAANAVAETSSAPAAGKGKKGKDAPAVVENSAEASKAEAKAPKKEKKEKEKKTPEAAEGGKKKAASGGGKAAAVDEGAGEPVPSMIDLRVGHIVHSMPIERSCDVWTPIDGLPS